MLKAISWLTGLIADPLRELLTRLSKKALPTPEESSVQFETDEKIRKRKAKDKANEVILENIK